MNKQLLIAAAVLAGTSLFAQGNRKSSLYQPVKNSVEMPSAEQPSFPTSSHKSGPVSQPHTAANCLPSIFSSSINAFAVGGGLTTFQQNCLSYNTDLNTVLWTSRVSKDWNFPGKTSGAIQSTWLNVGTNVWDSMIIYRDSALLRPARYPGGVLFNPPGNTSISNALMVGSGACTNAGGAAGWKGEWYAWRKPSGNYHATNIPNSVQFDSVGVLPFGNVGNSSTNVGFLNTDMCQAGNTVRVAGPLFDATSGEVKGGVIARGTYGSGTLTWDRDTIDANFLNTSQGLISDAEGPRIAFDPSGTIGYAVFNGRLATTYTTSADSTMMPVVFKTMDGGTTWTGPVLAGYDWSKMHPELRKNVGALQFTTFANRVTPYLRHGIDVTVDANGVLHYVTTLTCPYMDGEYVGGGFDSLQFTFSTPFDYVHYRPIIWDLMTDGSCWKTLMVDSVLTQYMAGAAATDNNPWENVAGSSWLAYGARVSVSRSSDGTQVFYGWADSDSAATGNNYNTQPDILMKAYDISTGMVSQTMNVSQVGQCFFHYISDVSYKDNATGKWTVPYVYTTARFAGSASGSFAGTQAVDYNYGACPTFDGTTTNLPAPVNQETGASACTIGIQTHNNYSMAVNCYPNPFNHATNILVNLNEVSAIDLKVYDAIGNLVYSKKVNGNVGENTIVFDGSSLSAGVYHFTIAAGPQKATRKMVIQK